MLILKYALYMNFWYYGMPELIIMKSLIKVYFSWRDSMLNYEKYIRNGKTAGDGSSICCRRIMKNSCFIAYIQ